MGLIGRLYEIIPIIGLDIFGAEVGITYGIYVLIKKKRVKAVG